MGSLRPRIRQCFNTHCMSSSILKCQRRHLSHRVVVSGAKRKCTTRTVVRSDIFATSRSFIKQYSSSNSNPTQLYNSGVSLVESGDVNGGFKLLLEAAKQGYAPAQVSVGQLYLEGRGEEEKENVALADQQSSTIDEAGKPTGGAASAAEVVAELKKTRKQNYIIKRNKARKFNKNTLENHGNRKEEHGSKNNEEILEKNETLALNWLQKAALQNNTDAMVQLGNFLMKQVDHEIQDEKVKKADISDKLREGMDWYYKASEQSPPHQDALYNLGIVYYEGVNGLLEKNPTTSFELIKRAAIECEDPSAFFFIGHVGLQGDENIPAALLPNETYAWDCVQRAAKEGHLGAMTFIFKFLLEENNPNRVGISEEEAEDMALAHLESAAKGGDPEALHLKADMLYGIDNPKALELYVEAGKAGRKEAWISAGAMYYNGLGSAKDHVSAYRAYEKAAQLGSIEAWKNLASLYYYGHGVVQCTETAEQIVEFLKGVEIED